MNKILLTIALALTSLLARADVPVYGFEVVNRYPHSKGAFTQGLQFHEGFLYEGTGQKGRSVLTKSTLEDGEQLMRKRLPSRYFGEGISIVGDRVFQLTWRANVVFVYDLNTFETITSHYHPTEGWGLTWNGEHLILSDGSSSLQFIDPETFALVKKVDVTLNGNSVSNLNELEYIDGEVWANVWMSDDIVRIDPDSGEVQSVVDLSGLDNLTELGGSGAVLNGIAWIEPTATSEGRLLVTGKLWGDIFEIKLQAQP
ncbi:MAG: glutaminyl-peptide cyclotransferase [Pseudohongiellaceae bacterium]|nr:glutaminyl-peptide cyclotransferase [Pseudohongiellaceae bacterium]